MTKHTIISLLTLLLLQVVAAEELRAQSGWSQEAACPGWHNPTSFVTGNPDYYYNGQVGQRANAAPDVMSGQTGLTNVSTLIAAGTLHTVTTSALTHEGSLPLPTQRFAIMTDTEGTDANTGDNLAYVPSGFTSSIRVGNAAVAEAVNASILSYTMRVTPDNALLLLHYALVMQQPSHSEGDGVNPLFNVRVMRDNAGTWQMVSDTLAWFHVVNQSDITPGEGGWQVAAGGTVYYKSWATVAFDLAAMLYQDVRIEVAVAGCQYGTHWGYAYVVGDCRPMAQSQGCADSTLTLGVPGGMQSYRWLASNRGIAAPPFDTATFRPLAGTGSTYAPQPDDFRVAEREIAPGEVVPADSLGTCQTFCCEMTSALDPNKPYTLRQYFNTCNIRIDAAITPLLQCDGTGTVVDSSHTITLTDTLDNDLTEWEFYTDSLFDIPPIATLTSSGTGSSVAVPFGSHDVLWVLMRSHNSLYGCQAEAVMRLAKQRVPTLAISGYRYLSAGTVSDITASSDMECTFQWSTAAGSIAGGLPAGPHLQVVVDSGRTTYYVCATTAAGCTACDSVTLYTGLRDTNLAGLFAKIDIDTLVCMHDTTTVRIGHAVTNEVVVIDQRASLSHPERVFLPDGVPCDGRCTYRSPVTFDNFLPGHTVTSVEEIVFVRLNMEHSFIGDLYIGITCPNGQHATLMRFNGLNSPCRDTIPTSARGWLDGNNVGGYTFLGMPINDEDADYKCDSTRPYNAPGTGWNYCWSNNTTAGITYASGDGIIYRQGHINNPHSSIDSSNVAAKSNFYHPDQNFGSLIGCPLNGTWVIEVIDGYSGDNGYIFDWELSLDASLTTGNITIIGSNVIGEQVNQVNDSTYVLSAPADATGDTTVRYIIQLMDSLGMVADTAVYIHYVDDIRHLEKHEACMGDTIRVGTEAFTETIHRFDTTYSAEGCPIITEYDIRFHPTYLIYDTARFCMGAPIEWRGRRFDTYGDTTFHDFTKPHCDSITRLTLQLIDSGFHARMEISLDDEQWSSDTLLADCRPFHLLLRDASPLGNSRTWLLGDGSTQTDDSLTHTYDSAGVYDLTLQAVSPNGCRDTMVMKQAVWVYQLPTPEFSWTPHSPVMSHPTVQMVNESSPSDHYLWLFSRADGAGQDSIQADEPQYTWGNGEENLYGEYPVTLVATLHHITPLGDTLYCPDSISHNITIVNDWLQFPNLVTPDGDGVNDTWRVVNLLECGMYPINELWIYDHWGAPVYHMRDISREEHFWNPDETRSPDGTYYFRFSAKSPYGLVRRNGVIEVMRKH